MRVFCVTVVVAAWAVGGAADGRAQDIPRPYRLDSVDLAQTVIWGAEVREPAGGGLTFGGQDQDADDGCPHTRVLIAGQWQAIHAELRAKNPLQPLHARLWQARNETKDTLARARHVYFKGLPADEETAVVKRDVAPRLSQLTTTLDKLIADLPTNAKDADEYATTQVRFAKQHLESAKSLTPAIISAVSVDALKSLHAAQIHLELAAEACDAEPPPRALDCGKARRQVQTDDPPSQALVYDAQSKLYVLFGGDHLDYLTNDTWVFDPAQRRWTQRHPEAAPPPRANHHLQATGEGKIRLTGGYTYTSNTDYVGGQYADLDDGEWLYDIATNQWQPAAGNHAKLIAADSRVYLSGPFHPDFYLQGDRPDAAKFDAWLRQLPVNEWVVTDPPYRPRLNRDWGTARIDPDRDLMLRWSGGHSAHGGTDVPHFHFSTNRWELPFPVEFPLGQLYSNTSYPNGFNFNLRPWMTGHTYQNYAYDPPSRMMVKAGRPRHYYVYDPDVGDWIGRGDKPAAMKYNSCFYTLTLTATPHGAVCWDANGRAHRFDYAGGRWIELELTGDKLPGAYVDNSTIAYDEKRDRVLIINTQGYQKPYDGQVWSLDMKTNVVKALSPQGMERAHRFANVDRCVYDAANELLLMGTYLRESGEHTPTPAFDCADNRWITLDIHYATGQRSGNTTRAFPHSRSDGLMFDAQRKLIWGTDTNSQIYVLRLDPSKANRKPL
jgi:hypothetical protein